MSLALAARRAVLQRRVDVLARWYWELCPAARGRLVDHEIGHSVGHVMHEEAGRVMAPSVDCEGDTDPLPTDEERARADAVRVYGIRMAL